MSENKCPSCDGILNLKSTRQKTYIVYVCSSCNRRWHSLKKSLKGDKTMKTKEMEKLNVIQYVGNKTTIASATIEIPNEKYGMALIVKTESLEELKDGKQLRASAIFSFMKDDDGSYYVGIDSKLDKFLKLKGLTADCLPDEPVVGMTIPELVGVPVVVQLNTKTNYLDFI